MLASIAIEMKTPKLPVLTKPIAIILLQRTMKILIDSFAYLGNNQIRSLPMEKVNRNTKVPLLKTFLPVGPLPADCLDQGSSRAREDLSNLWPVRC